MSEKTKIEWATSTGNPWIGCTKVSPGCKNCYAAELDAKRFSKTMGGGTKAVPVSHWGKGAPRFRTKGFWKDALRWNKEANPDDQSRQDWPLCERPRIFPSLCDWLDEEVPIEWLADFLKLIHDTPNLDWLLLTKRPENFRHLLHKVAHLGNELAVRWHMLQQAPPNIWLGVSVEDQQRADERIPALLKIPAKVRFLSVEPLLGPLHPEWGTCLYSGFTEPPHDDVINWVIVGGESGKGARPCNVEWIRSIMKQCQAADVPCFVKQLGGFCVTDEASPDAWPAGTKFLFSPFREEALAEFKDPKGGDPAEWPEDVRVRQFPKL